MIALLLDRPGPGPARPGAQLRDVAPDVDLPPTVPGLLLRAIGILTYGVALVVAALSLLLLEAVVFTQLLFTVGPPT